MTVFFRQGFVDYMTKAASLRLPVLKYFDNSEEERPSWKESVEIAAKKIFGLEDPPPVEQYSVTTTKPGTKQRLADYSVGEGTENRVKRLEKKWSTPGVEPTVVGSKRRT